MQEDLFARIPTVHEKVHARVNDARTVATEEQTQVLNALVLAHGKLTQRNLVDACPGIGAHRREVDAGIVSPTSLETTLRRVRQIVRDLRVELRVPILSDPSGYWLPRTEDEVAEYVDRVEKQARATARAWFETLRSLDGFLNDGRQRALFDVIAALGGEP
jgi:hypothetical protein